MTSVLVVEDDAPTREALVAALRYVGYAPAAVTSGEEALAEVRSGRPDLIVLDMGLPDMDGTEAVLALRQLCDSPIIVVSGSRRTRRKADALDAGADDFLDKPFDVAELRARLRAAERRLERPVAPRYRRSFGEVEVDIDGRCLSRGSEEVRLTDIEWRLLDVLVSEAGRVVTHRRLTTLVWGARAGSEMQPSLRVHVASLRRKLGDGGRSPTFIRAESGVGYRWVATATIEAAASPGHHDSLVERVTSLRNDLAARAATSCGAERSALDEAVGLAESLYDTLVGMESG